MISKEYLGIIFSSRQNAPRFFAIFIAALQKDHEYGDLYIDHPAE